MIYFDSCTAGLSKPITMCVKFAQRAEREEIPFGRHNLENGIYCSVLETDSKFEEKDYYEAHRKYADVHYVIDGEFFMSVGAADKMEFDSYTEEKDFVKIFGKPYLDVPLNKGTAVCLFPNDAHCAKANPKTQKKMIKIIIFKIPMELFGND